MNTTPARAAAPVTRTVTIPDREQHEGRHSRQVALSWQCPTCGGPRGVPEPGLSFDGSCRLPVDTWRNPCGHVDSYTAVRREADRGRAHTTAANAPRWSTCII